MNIWKKRKNNTEKSYKDELFLSDILVDWKQSSVVKEVEINDVLDNFNDVENEKKQVITALKDFIETTAIEDGDGKKQMDFPGGKVISHSGNEIKWNLSISEESIEECYKELPIPFQIFERLKINFHKKSIKVIFYTDCLREENEELKIVTESSQKMIDAMATNVLGLDKDDFVIIPIRKDSVEDTFDEKWPSLMQKEIFFYNPSAIICLGAKVTTAFTKESLRLADIHGSFYYLTVNIGKSVTKIVVMPLFHPDVMDINKNTKKTAKKDLEKLSAYLKNNA